MPSQNDDDREPSAATLARHLPGSLRERLAGTASLPTLLALLARGPRRWPELTVADRDWVEYLARRLPDEVDLERMLGTLRAEDLFLCCACAGGDPAAIEAFRADASPVIASALRRLRLGATLTEELHQQLLIDLLVGGEQRPPALASYAGIGKLHNWLRVVATRTGRTSLQAEKKLVPSDDDRLAEELVVEAPPHAGLGAEKPSYYRAFRQAFKQALAELTPRDLTLLRQRYIDGVGLEALGAIYRVHHTTIHRRLTRVKETVIEQTHARLSRQLMIPERDCSTIIRVIRSDLDLTLGSLLARDRTEGEG